MCFGKKDLRYKLEFSGLFYGKTRDFTAKTIPGFVLG